MWRRGHIIEAANGASLPRGKATQCFVFGVCDALLDATLGSHSKTSKHIAPPAMSSEGFPKVELNEPADLKHVLDAIKEHALALANAELKADKATTPLELEATRKALDLVSERAFLTDFDRADTYGTQCIAGMRRKLELNVLVNNMTFDDLATHKTREHPPLPPSPPLSPPSFLL